MTGGAGFIGSHIVDAYVERGYRVVVIDNLSTGFRKNLNPKAKFYKADTRNAKKINEIFQKERPDVVNHHAAVSEVARSLRNPKLTFDVNITGTENVLLASGIYHAKNFIFPSSGGTVYGDPKEIPTDESIPLDPLSPYAFSKAVNEQYIKFYAHRFGFKYLILRYANVYGPRQNPKGEAGVIAIFGGLIGEGRRPTIFGDGTKTRDYIHISDVVRANILGLTRGKNEILNLGFGKEITDQNVFDAVAKSMGFKGKPIYAPFRKGENRRIALKNARAKRVLKWDPKTGFQDGVRSTLTSL